MSAVQGAVRRRALRTLAVSGARTSLERVQGALPRVREPVAQGRADWRARADWRTRADWRARAAMQLQPAMRVRLASEMVSTALRAWGPLTARQVPTAWAASIHAAA